MNDKLRNQLINKSLKKYGVTIEKILEFSDQRLVKTGKMKGKKEEYLPYYEIYHFDDEVEFQEWKDYCMKELEGKVMSPEDEFNMLDLTWGLSQPYLFNKKG